MKYEIYNTFAVGASPYNVIAICLTREEADKCLKEVRQGPRSRSRPGANATGSTAGASTHSSSR